MNDLSNPHEIPSNDSTADTPIASPNTVSAVRTPRRSRLRAIRVENRIGWYRSLCRVGTAHRLLRGRRRRLLLEPNEDGGRCPPYEDWWILRAISLSALAPS